MSVLNLGEANIRYELSGEGEPLILIPGFASGAWSWEWQTKNLSRDFRVITFDPRGIGDSTLHEGAAMSIPAIADDVISLLDHIGLGSAHVLGISFGGFVAQELALRYPLRVKKLVLASTSFGGPNHVSPAMEVLAAFASTEGLNSANRIRRYITMAFSSVFANEHPEVVDRFCELREQNVVPENVYRQQLASAMTFGTEKQVAEIKAETLVITGREDTVVPMRNSENLVGQIPGASLEVIEGTGHMAFVERADEFNALVSKFLKRLNI